MSEYITIETEATDDRNVMRLVTNQRLAPEGMEVYADPESGDEGSPLAQTLFGIEGIVALTLDGGEILVRRDSDAEWFNLIEEIKDALKDFFL